MTREEAINKVSMALMAAHRYEGAMRNFDHADMVIALEALGLLKLDDTKPDTMGIPAISYTQDGIHPGARGYATCYVKTVIETLHMMGYAVVIAGALEPKK